MEERIKNTKIRRLLAFGYDIIFIMLAAFTVHMIFGLIFKLDSEAFQSYMIYITLAVIIAYLLFGELIFRNSLGKYIFGIEVTDPVKFERPSSGSFIKRGLLKIIWPIEGIVLLFSRPKKRMGDIWSKSIVVNKVTNRLKPYARLILGVSVIVAMYFSFSISLGFAARGADFYKEGAQYLTGSGQVTITGLPKEVSQARDTVSFEVPVSVENLNRFALIHLVRSDGKWIAYKAEFFSNHIGAAFNYSFSSK
jgi:uncharacterized RDD family membrane protein YckC